MLSYLKASFCLFLILSLQKISDVQAVLKNLNVPNKDDHLDGSSYDELVKLDIIKELPGYFSEAVEIWKKFESYNSLYRRREVQVFDIDARIDMLDNREAHELFKDGRIFSELHIDHDTNVLIARMKNLEKLLNRMMRFYSEFRELTNSTNFIKEEMYYFVTMVSRKDGVTSTLYQIQSELKPFYDAHYKVKNLFTLLSKSNFVYELMCKSHQSAQKIIYLLYQHVLMAEARGYVVLKFSMSVLAKKNKNELPRHINYEFEKRLQTAFDAVSVAMKNADRQIRQCDSNLIEGESYEKLHPIFQKIVLWDFETFSNPVIDWERRITNGTACEPSCENISDQKQLVNIGGWSQRGNGCSGKLRSCGSQSGVITVCKSKDASYRRYDWIKHGPYDIDGHDSPCEGRERRGQTGYAQYMDWIITRFADCEVCLCTCDTSASARSVNFDIVPVISDIHINKVITGIKIGMKNKPSAPEQSIHFEILQGTLSANGVVKDSKKVFYPQITHIPFQTSYPAEWNPRTVICLDVLDYRRPDRVLTGVRFALGHNKEIQVNIHMTKFDLITGKLDPDDSLWFNQQDLNDAAKRSELDINNLKLPNSKSANEERSQPGQCIRLEMSSMSDDAGQTVVPFIDTQWVAANPPAPLSGFGLYLRGAKDTSGFLSPKIITYDNSIQFQET